MAHSREQILNEDYCEELDERCKDAIVQSHYKYGSVAENYSNGLINARRSIDACLNKYDTTGNIEYLVDAANYIRFEYKYPKHPKAHFRATSSNESAGIVGMSHKQMEEANAES